MEPWLIFRILGGLSFSVAHRYIVRRAWKESTGWGAAAMFVPGLSLFFAYRYRADLGRPLCAQIAGIALVTAGFAMAMRHSLPEPATVASIHNSPKVEKVTPAPVAVPASAPAVAEHPANLSAWYASLNARKATLTTPEAIQAFNREAADYQLALQASRKISAPPVAAASPPVAAVPAITGPEQGLFRWHESIEARRAALDLSNAEAVRKLKDETDRYEIARDGTKPLRDELKPLRDDLKPLAGTKQAQL